MTLGQVLLPYALIPILIVTILGIRRARKAGAGWIAWSPVLLYLGTIGVAYLGGFAEVAVGLPSLVVSGMIWLCTIASAGSGVWLFVRFRPTDAAP